MNCWLQVTSGEGPDECGWVVARVMEAIVQEAAAKGYRAEVLEAAAGGRPGLLKSALVSVEGEGLPEWLKQWEGTVQWIGRSAFRPHHKRKNWFIGVTCQAAPEATDIRESELRFECMRSSGPGGQHTNKTESAVRVTHVPTGLNAVGQEERSQHMNRKLAVARLYAKLEQRQQAAQQAIEQARWEDHHSLERGNPVRVYEGQEFRLKRIAGG